MTERQVVFVCEHGAAKSVLAAAYFNAQASRLGLALRAVPRGTSPDPGILPAVLAGLAAEQLVANVARPEALVPADLASAALVVSFDQPAVAALAPEGIPVLPWDGLPPVSADYARARAAIRERAQALAAHLAERGTP